MAHSSFGVLGTINTTCEQEMCDLRDYLIFQSAEKQNRNVADLRKNVLAWPVLVAKGSQILGRRKCA